MMNESYLLAIWHTNKEWEDDQFNIGLFKSLEELEKFVQNNYTVDDVNYKLDYNNLPTYYVRSKDSFFSEKDKQYYINIIENNEDGIQSVYHEKDNLEGFIYVQVLNVLG